MDLSSPTQIKELLARHGAKPLKGLGQNFLLDKSVLAKIIGAADLQKTDTVLEIGPGIGTLTQALAQKANSVIAIEKDAAMVQILQETLKGCTNVNVVGGDILKLDPKPYTLNPYKLVANIPYYITSPIIRMFLETPHQPQAMVLMVQKEVAQRICAKPGDMSILAVSVQFYASAKIIATVPKGCFWPVPNVDSAILQIIPLAQKPATDADDFFKVVKAGFSHPRKQLAGNLAEGLKVDKQGITTWLLQNNIQPTQRAETLTIKDWRLLTENLDML